MCAKAPGMFQAALPIVVALLIAFPVSADPLIVERSVKPENAKIGDVVAVYVKLLGTENESVTIVTYLDSPTFRVRNLLSGSEISYTPIGGNAAEFEVAKGQAVSVTVFGRILDPSKPLLVIFPNMERIELAEEIVPTPTAKNNTEIAEVGEDEQIKELWRKFSALESLFGNCREEIEKKSPRLIPLVEDDLAKARMLLEKGAYDDVRTILRKLEGVLSGVCSQEGDEVEVLVIVGSALAACAAAVATFWFAFRRREGGE